MALFKKKKQLDSSSMKNGVGLITVTKPTSPIAEQFRTIRTNVQFSSADRQLKTLLLTSADPSEGKSTISSNVAVTWADQGNKVLLIDSDLRRPAVARSFRVSNSQGLTTILTAKQANLSESIHETEVPNLYVLPSGPVPPNPSELLNSSKMDQLLKVLKEQFDIIILDVPPVNIVTDAQILASKVDGVILVVPQGIALKGAVLRARDLLKKVNANLIGAVLNRVTDAASGGYYGGYYGSYYGTDDKK